MTAQTPTPNQTQTPVPASAVPDVGDAHDVRDAWDTPDVCETPNICDPAQIPPPLQQAVTASARDLRERIGRNLLRLRRNRRMTLKQLSRRTGLGMPLLDHFELGKNDIELRQLLMIAQVLGADWRALLEEREA